MRASCVLLTLLIIASGCTDPAAPDIDDDTDDPAADPGPRGPRGTQSDNDTAPANTPPVASLTADVVNGTAPLAVNFTIEGSDADRDNLTWTLDADGDGVADANGTQLPQTFSFVFGVGNFTANLTVDDGRARAMAHVTVRALEGAEVPFEPVTMSQEVLLACPHCFGSDATQSSTCIGVAAGQNGLDCAWFDLESSWVGRTWSVSGTLLPLVEFHPDCTGADRLSFALEGTGTIPEGAGCMIVFDVVDPVVTVVAKIS